jgi:hypothetical protein
LESLGFFPWRTHPHGGVGIIQHKARRGFGQALGDGIAGDEAYRLGVGEAPLNCALRNGLF